MRDKISTGGEELKWTGEEGTRQDSEVRVTGGEGERWTCSSQSEPPKEVFLGRARVLSLCVPDAREG